VILNVNLSMKDHRHQEIRVQHVEIASVIKELALVVVEIDLLNVRKKKNQLYLQRKKKRMLMDSKL